MSWQEELRRLDEELAAGRISADDYRVRRDQVLSSAVSQGETPGQQASGNDQQQGQPADSTQVVQPVNQGNADSTQFVSAPQQNAGQAQQWQPQQAWGHPGQQSPQSPAAGFQQPPQQQGGFAQQPPQQRQAAWNAPEADATPPWGGSDLPPIQAPESDSWASQGPEGFEDRKSGGGKTKIVASVVAVVLLGGVAFGAYWLWGREGASPDPGTNTVAQAPTTKASPTQKPEDELPIAMLPGAAEKHPEVKTFADVEGLNYLNDEELGIYKEAGPAKTKFYVQHFDNGNLAVFLLVKTSDVEKPPRTEQELAEVQVSNGAEPAPEAPQGTAVTKYSNDKLAQIRAHYFSGNILVRVEVISKESPESASTQFESVIRKQLQELPANA